MTPSPLNHPVIGQRPSCRFPDLCSRADDKLSSAVLWSDLTERRSEAGEEREETGSGCAAEKTSNKESNRRPSSSGRKKSDVTDEELMRYATETIRNN